jgi:hypothetical protein
MFERWRTRRYIRIVLSSNEDFLRRDAALKGLSKLPMTDESLQALTKVASNKDLNYGWRSDAEDTLKRWSSETAIATRALCQLIEDPDGPVSFTSFRASDFRGDERAAIQSHLRIAQRHLNSSEPVWSSGGWSRYEKLNRLLERLQELGAQQSQLANLQSALPRLRIARIPFLAECALTSDYYGYVLPAIRELCEIATPDAHVALVKFWRTCGDRIYKTEYSRTVPDYNDRSGFATETGIEETAASRIRDELKGAARENCEAAKLQADTETRGKFGPAGSDISDKPTRKVVPCPGCNTRLALPVGKTGKVKCPRCSRMFQVAT